MIDHKCNYQLFSVFRVDFEIPLISFASQFSSQQHLFCVNYTYHPVVVSDYV